MKPDGRNMQPVDVRMERSSVLSRRHNASASPRRSIQNSLSGSVRLHPIHTHKKKNKKIKHKRTDTILEEKQVCEPVHAGNFCHTPYFRKNSIKLFRMH